MTLRNGRDTQPEMPVSKLVGVRLPDALRERIEAHRKWLHQQTGLELTLSMTIKSLVERGLEAFEEKAHPPRKR